MIFKKGDILFYLILIFLLLLFYYRSNKSESNIVEIIYNGVVVDNLDSSIDSTYTFNSEYYSFSLLVKSGGVKIVKSGCKDKLCTKIGEIKRGDNSTIICLPQKIVVKFKVDKESDLDGIAG
ncbi:MAG: hypothetical protein CR982_08265 [Candidatus Cloacimonadota bacterium]|nr:MAG: hypothetical protein CR982_08265 [Candidatus Cloacimonadota bacterium]PIE79046.1 MAG: hypothetical protein CSA15_04710 [Candidatus Delongbacteria bacterium]